jgi:hypothetical protein
MRWNTSEMGILRILSMAAEQGPNDAPWRSRRCQRLSLWGWFGASSCTIVSECTEIVEAARSRRGHEAEDEWRARQRAALADVNRRLLVLFHAVVQARADETIGQLHPVWCQCVGWSCSTRLCRRVRTKR